jgi:hypothetical protein
MKKINWYVQIPSYMGGEVHPRYWQIVCAEEGSEQDEIFRTQLIRNGCGELVPTTSWYQPFPDEQSCFHFIESNFRKWDD